MITSFEYSLTGNMDAGQDDINLRMDVAKAFNRAYNHGKRDQFLAKIFGKENHLESLSSQPIEAHRPTSRIISVPIHQIKGSLGRSDDFDLNFNPLKERSRSRWMSIAAAVRIGLPMPAVELVQVGNAYYVRDGHHRISVAKSMGQDAIDARIVNG
jgi:hypothetical protein